MARTTEYVARERKVNNSGIADMVNAITAPIGGVLRGRARKNNANNNTIHEGLDWNDGDIIEERGGKIQTRDMATLIGRRDVVSSYPETSTMEAGWNRGILHKRRAPSGCTRLDRDRRERLGVRPGSHKVRSLDLTRIFLYSR
jgi:hypothetical protein